MKKSIQQFKVFSKKDISKVKGGKRKDRSLKKDKSLKIKTNITAAMASGAIFCPPPEPEI